MDLNKFTGLNTSSSPNRSADPARGDVRMFDGRCLQAIRRDIAAARTLSAPCRRCQRLELPLDWLTGWWYVSSKTIPTKSLEVGSISETLPGVPSFETPDLPKVGHCFVHRANRARRFCLGSQKNFHGAPTALSNWPASAVWKHAQINIQKVQMCVAAPAIAKPSFVGAGAATRRERCLAALVR